jgi:hypothetical protein
MSRFTLRFVTKHLEEVVVEKIVCASKVNRCTLFCPAGARQGQ